MTPPQHPVGAGQPQPTHERRANSERHEIGANGEPSPEWLRANIKPPGGKVMGVPVGDVLRESKRAGWKVVAALAGLVAAAALLLAVWKYGPPVVTTAAHAAGDSETLQRIDKQVTEALFAITQLKIDLAADRAERKALEERVRSVEIKVGPK